MNEKEKTVVELKKCPLCNCEAELEHSICDSVVRCTSILCRARLVFGNSSRLTPHQNMKRVATAWNTRPRDHLFDEMRQALEYWLPRENPLPHVIGDPIGLEHVRKWNEAKDLITKLHALDVGEE